MTTYRAALAATITVCISLLSSSGAVPAQTPSPFAGASVQHVGLVVHDINTAVKDYADFLGVPVPEVGEARTIQYVDSYEGDHSAWARIAMFGMGDILLDLVEPVGGASPWRNHLDRAGEGLQHVCIEVDDVAPAVQELLRRGGTPETTSYVNMVDALGITFEVHKRGTMKAAGYVNLPTPTKFAAGAVEHVGVVVRDADKAGKLMADILGMASPEASVQMGAKMVYLDTKPVGIEFIEPAGGNNVWRAHLDKVGGPGIHHVAVTVERLQENIEYAQKHGGQVVVPPTNGRAVVDLQSHPLPFAVELIER